MKKATGASPIKVYNAQGELIATVDPVTGKRTSVAGVEEVMAPLKQARIPRIPLPKRGPPSPSVELSRKGKWR